MTIRKIKPMAEALEEWQLSRSQERERQLALLRLPHEELVAKLWQRVMIPDSLVHIALDMSPGAWQALKASGNAPARIKLGALRYVFSSALLEWLTRQEKTMAIKERRHGKRRAHAHVKDDETTNAGTAVATAHDHCHPGLQATGRNKPR